ncbi:MAG TPA: phosphatidylglycerol lysyltransferase domain-containing protein [Elusimicrobiales bacterium]|nr:phosphatidylglycerol lysyltransferase domain-containing protein [Elusimicrobiales bacterium]
MFNRLKPEDYAGLCKHFELHNYPLCEYSLASVIIWNHCQYDVAWKTDGDLLLLAETDLKPPAARRLLMPLPAPLRAVAPAELAAVSARNRRDPFYYIPGCYVEPNRAALEKLFTIAEQPGFMDYIYGTRDLAELAGHKYSKKRNLIAQFRKNTAALRKVEVQPITAKNSGLCLSVLDRWSHDPEAGARLEMLNCERKAIIAALNNLAPLGLLGVLVQIDGEVCGFALGSRLSRDTFVLNFEKALDNFKGLYQFLDNELAKSLPANYVFINKESDLELPGLAKAKESYYPVRKERSYTLTLK